MHISYKPLWHTLLERDMRKEDLRLAVCWLRWEHLQVRMGFVAGRPHEATFRKEVSVNKQIAP